MTAAGPASRFYCGKHLELRKKYSGEGASPHRPYWHCSPTCRGAIYRVWQGLAQGRVEQIVEWPRAGRRREGNDASVGHYEVSRRRKPALDGIGRRTRKTTEPPGVSSSCVLGTFFNCHRADPGSTARASRSKLRLGPRRFISQSTRLSTAQAPNKTKRGLEICFPDGLRHGTYPPKRRTP